MSATVWSTDEPKYPGYYWAISRHGEIDLVRVRSIVHDYPSTGNLLATKYNYTFGDMCAPDTMRWTHWTPAVAPERPAKLPEPPTKKEEPPRKMGHRERNEKVLEDAIREQTKQAPIKARFQTLTAAEGDTVSQTVRVGEGMMVIDGVAVMLDLGMPAKDDKVSDLETGWNLVRKDLLDRLSKIAHGREEVGVRHLLAIAKEIAAEVVTMSEAGRAGAYRRLRAVNPTVLCMVKSFVTPANEKEDNSLPRP